MAQLFRAYINWDGPSKPDETEGLKIYPAEPSDNSVATEERSDEGQCRFQQTCSGSFQRY